MYLLSLLLFFLFIFFYNFQIIFIFMFSFVFFINSGLFIYLFKVMKILIGGKCVQFVASAT